MSKDLAKDIVSNFEDTGVSFINKYRMVIQTPEKELIRILNYLKDRGYNYLALMSCVDWLDENVFELVYHIGKIEEALKIIVKTRIPRENPVFKTVMNIFKNAQIYEREIHELFGINFEGNPDLQPLFLDEWQKFHPFRKDFDSRKYVEQTFNRIPAVEENK